jgi:CheY-like chemotaxis protein
MDSFFKGKTFFVTDDSLSQRKKIRLLGEHLQMVYQGEASDGLECLESLKEQPVDFLFLDILMPKMHGLEVLQQIQAEKRPVSVIIMTALEAIDEHIDQSDLQKPFAILKKGMSFDQILTKLRKAQEKLEEV